MRRPRFVLTMAMLAVGLLVATNPVFAAGGATTTGAKSPGSPALPEAPVSILLPLVGFAVVGLVFCVMSRRARRALDAPSE